MERLPAVRLLALAVLLVAAACARTSRLVNESQNIYEVRKHELQGMVQSSLAAEKWSLVEQAGTIATRRTDGSYSIVMAIRYLDLEDRSAFSLEVSSTNTWDFFTFNNLGASRLSAAIETAQAWLDSFRAAHATSLVTAGSS